MALNPLPPSGIAGNPGQIRPSSPIPQGTTFPITLPPLEQTLNNNPQAPLLQGPADLGQPVVAQPPSQLPANLGNPGPGNPGGNLNLLA